MIIKFKKAQHIKNIKYKGFHPSDKKKTIKKINDLIDKFNGTSEKDYGELAKFLNKQFEYNILRSYEGLRELEVSIIKFVGLKREKRVEDFDKFMEITTTDSSSKLDSIEKKVIDQIKKVGELEANELYLVENIIIKVRVIVNKFENSCTNINAWPTTFFNSGDVCDVFQKRGFGAVSRNIFIGRLHSEVHANVAAYIESRLEKFAKKFDEFLKSVAEDFSSGKIEGLEGKIGRYDKTLEQKEKSELDSVSDQMESCLFKMFDRLKHGGIFNGKDSFVDKQKRKLIEMGKLLEDLINKLPEDFSELKPALTNLKSVVDDKKGKITKNDIKILKKYFSGNRSWFKWKKDDTIKDKYNLPFVQDSDNETKYTIFSFMSMIIDSPYNGADNILQDLSNRKNGIFK